MNYIDVFHSRVNHLGETTAERIRNGGRRSFEKWKAESPHTVRHLSVERGIYFDGIIIRHKDKEYEKILFLHVSSSIPLLIGDIMTWKQDDGTDEKWIVIQEEKKVNGTYRSFWIIRCNYYLKWIDEAGHLQASWAYVVSSVDSKIKGNYRTWHNLITPQPNKYAEILMPRYPIARSTNFIIEDESWAVIEYDHTSVPGTIYLSLTENKINRYYDDTVENIADTDRRAVYELKLPEAFPSYIINEPIVIEPYTLMKNGLPCSSVQVNFISTNYAVAKPINGVLTAIGEGDCQIKVELAGINEPVTPESFTIHVGVATDVNEGYIDGPDYIRISEQAIYEFIPTNDNQSFTAQFSIEPNKLVILMPQSDNKCIIKANNIKGELGSIVLSALYNGKTYTKDISIVPLWR